jgi:hypothetical protein
MQQKIRTPEEKDPPRCGGITRSVMTTLSDPPSGRVLFFALF